MDSDNESRFWPARRIARRRLFASAGAASVAASALLAACGNKSSKTASSGGASGPAGAIKRGGTISAFVTSPSSEDLEPHGARSNSASTQPLLALVYSGLLRLKVGEPLKFTDRTVEGVIAAKWEQPDPQTIVFSLRPGVKFHNKAPVNGREVNSSDVKFTFERLLGSPFAYVNFFSSIASIDTPDPQTVIIKTKAPDATILSHLANGFAWIIAKEAGKPDSKGIAGTSFKDASTAIGTGPFMLDAYESGTKAVFVRNPAYFESGFPYLDKVEYQFLPDTVTQLAAIQSGQATIGKLPLGSEADFKARNPKLLYSSQFDTASWHKGMRTDQAPFSDVRVRRALAMAYDQSSVKKVWGTPDSPSSYGSLTAVNGDYYLPAEQLGDNAKWWKVDIAAAKQLLSAAGYPNGFEADYNDSTCCDAQELPEQFAADLAKIGVKLNIKIKQHAAYQATTIRGEYEGTAGNQVPVYDPDDWFSVVLLPNSPRNLSHMNDPLVSDLTVKQRAELDPKRRLDLVHQLVQYLAGQAYQLVEPQSVVTEVRQPFVRNYAPRLGYQPTLMVAWLDK